MGRPSLTMWVGLLILTAIISPLTGYCQAAKAHNTCQTSDGEVIAALASLDQEDAGKAVDEVMRRGERMIPLLKNLRGDKRFYYGPFLGGRDSAWNGAPLPEADSDPNSGRYRTIEVVALYVISAIYYGTVEFAGISYLMDKTVIKNEEHNTPPRVAMAWQAVEKWIAEWEHEGLESLRKKKRDPLFDSKVRFY